MFEKILLAVDGSDHALSAARMASGLAKAMNSKTLRIVTAYDPIPPYLGEPNMQEAINARLDETKKTLQKALEAVGEIPGEVETEHIEGNAADVIIEAAKTHGSDVIVMGSRGLGKLAGLVLGSTSQKVVSHALCPVLIVR